MSFPGKLVSGLKDAFSYVIHFESASDRARKGEAVDKLAGEGAPQQLRDALMKTRTKHLDTLLAKNVAVELDTLPVQPLAADTPDLTLEGRFRPAKDGALGGTLTISGTSSPQDMATAVEKFARLLRDETPKTELYGLRSTVFAAGGEGMASAVSVIEWHAVPGYSLPQKTPKAAKPG